MTDKHLLIQRYLDGELSGNELTQFEQKMNADQSFRKEVDFLQAFRKDLTIHQRIKDKELVLKNKLDSIGSDFFDAAESDRPRVEKKKSFLPDFFAFLYPKPALKLAGFGFLLLLFSIGLSSYTHSNQAIIANAYLALSGLKSSSDPALSNYPNYKKGKEAYEQQSFKESIVALEKVPDRNPGIYLDAQHLLAHAYFKEKNFESAIKKFTLLMEVKDIPGNINRSSLEWNRLLAYIGNNQKPDGDFQQALEQIKEGGGPYADKALALEKKLNSFWRNLALFGN